MQFPGEPYSFPSFQNISNPDPSDDTKDSLGNACAGIQIPLEKGTRTLTQDSIQVKVNRLALGWPD